MNDDHYFKKKEIEQRNQRLNSKALINKNKVYSISTYDVYVYDAIAELNQMMIRSFRFQKHHQRNGNELGFGVEPVNYD